MEEKNREMKRKTRWRSIKKGNRGRSRRGEVDEQEARAKLRKEGRRTGDEWK